jgi:DNA-binding IclR family transcriptional regulator
MSDGEWHQASEIAEILGLKDTRTKQLLRELVEAGKLEDDGKTKGKAYRLRKKSY